MGETTYKITINLEALEEPELRTEAELAQYCTGAFLNFNGLRPTAEEIEIGEKNAFATLKWKRRISLATVVRTYAREGRVAVQNVEYVEVLSAEAGKYEKLIRGIQKKGNTGKHTKKNTPVNLLLAVIEERELEKKAKSKK